MVYTNNPPDEQEFPIYQKSPVEEEVEIKTSMNFSFNDVNNGGTIILLISELGK